jgi:hypothetical protein
MDLIELIPSEVNLGVEVFKAAATEAAGLPGS